jgi:uncharacterized protein with ParB-like and HNH nuclease domain
MIALENQRIAETAIREHEKQIRFKIKPFRIADIVDKYNKKQFYIPDYQRDDVWNSSMKSKFIESVLLGLPLPDMYASETDVNDEDYDGLAQFEIIDGSQRIRTLASFVSNGFALKKTETIKELEGFKYSDLTDFRKDKFNDVTIDVIILQPDTTDEVKNEMFDRINTSNPLKEMELRRGTCAGYFNDFIRKCGDILKNEYSNICQISTYFKNRREEEELILRFFAFSETFEKNLTFTNFEGKEISKSKYGTDQFLTLFYEYQNQRLKNLEQENNVAYQKEIDRLHTNLIEMLDFVAKNFPNGFKREKSKSVARIVFEAISVGVHLAIKEDKTIKERKIDTSWIKNDKKFVSSITQAHKIIERINIVKDNLLNQ